jgi:hypothetical protein
MTAPVTGDGTSDADVGKGGCLAIPGVEIIAIRITITVENIIVKRVDILFPPLLNAYLHGF